MHGRGGGKPSEKRAVSDCSRCLERGEVLFNIGRFTEQSGYFYSSPGSGNCSLLGWGFGIGAGKKPREVLEVVAGCIRPLGKPFPEATAYDKC